MPSRLLDPVIFTVILRRESREPLLLGALETEREEAHVAKVVRGPGEGENPLHELRRML